MNEVNSLAEIDFSKDVTLPFERVRELIAEFEAKMASFPQMEITIEHHFSEGVYAREMRVPKGTILIGKIHKFQNLNILSQGEVTVISIDGSRRVKAPFTFVASPGSQRVFYIHEDAVWTTIHGTHEKDVEKIEAEFIAKSYDEVPALDGTSKEVKCLGSQ